MANEIPELDLDDIEVSAVPSCVFNLDGKKFRCRAKEDIHWDTVERWLIARQIGSREVAVEIDGFFAALLFPEDFESFMEIKKDPTGSLTSARATSLVQFVNQKVLGIEGAADPTKRPANSDRGSLKTGSTSKAERRSPASKKESVA